MKKKYMSVIPIIAICVSLAGCSGIAKEKEMKEDLTAYKEGELLEKGEKITKVVIDERKTDKKQGNDRVWCTVTIEDSKISSEKEMELSYHKYDKRGWTLDDVEVEDSDDWEVSPLKGIEKKDIPETLVGKSVKIDGEKWKISKGEIKEISIDKQKTDLEKKTDQVTISIMLEGKVLQAKGELVVSYRFDRHWGESKVLEAKNFSSEPIPEKVFDVTEDDLIENLTQETITYGEDTRLKQEIGIAKEEISDFKIEKRESANKGTEESVSVSCLLNKKHVVLGLQVVFQYAYDEQWEMTDIETTTETKSFDILGTWSGVNTKAGGEDKIVFDITKVDGNKIEATYSYTPTGYGDAGSYYAAGEIDPETLNINLTAGDWIVHPEKDAFQKKDIQAAINVDMGIIEGYGNHGYAFRVEKQ